MNLKDKSIPRNDKTIVCSFFISKNTHQTLYSYHCLRSRFTESRLSLSVLLPFSLSLFCPFSLTVSLFFPHGKLNGSTTEILHRYNQLLFFFFFFFVFCILYYNRRISSLCIIVCCVPHQPNHSFPPLVNAIYNRIIEGGIDCGSLIKAHNRVRKTR